MARSTLNRTGEQPPVIRKGHGTGALGPSDSSDSGSDVQGGPGLADDLEEQRRSGDTSEPEAPTRSSTAGPDVGDANLDSDSDAEGSGERATAGRDTTYESGSDIAPDRIETTADTRRPERRTRGYPSRRRRRGKQPG